MPGNGKVKDAALDEADSYLTKASALAENDEILVLQSWSKSARIAVNPMTRGQKYGAESATFLDKAMKMNPDNPRINFLKGQSAFYTPEAFGGSKTKAKEMFMKDSKAMLMKADENFAKMMKK